MRVCVVCACVRQHFVFCVCLIRACVQLCPIEGRGWLAFYSAGHGWWRTRVLQKRIVKINKTLADAIAAKKKDSKYVCVYPLPLLTHSSPLVGPGQIPVRAKP